MLDVSGVKAMQASGWLTSLKLQRIDKNNRVFGSKENGLSV